MLFDEATNTAYNCKCRPQLIARRQAGTLSAVIPKRYRGVSFDRAPIVDMDPEIVRVVRRYVEAVDGNLDAGRGLWFTGDVGTGKTTLAMLVSRAALDAGRSVAIYSLPRLLAEIRKTFDEGAERSHVDLLERLAAVDLLHVDDVGAERTSDWVLEQLYSIVNARYEDERAMLITTNLDHAELREQIGERTVSRLIEICGDPLPLYGHDRRMDLRAS
jgi:DNA replication protein DnaC